MRTVQNPARFISRSGRGTKTIAILAAAAASFVGSRAMGQNTATWTDANGTNNWSDAANWTSTGTVPPGNDTGSTTNTDTAVFNTTIASPNNAVNVDTANWNLQNILFDTNAGGFGIGSATSGFSLLLTNGGNITVSSAVTFVGTESIAAPVLIEGNSYSLIDNAAAQIVSGSTVSTGLSIANSISGAVSGTTNLILGGTSPGGTSGNSVITGAITDGSATTLNIVKQGAGQWQLGNTASPSVINTYNGSTTINGGILRILTANALPSSTDVVVNGTGAELLLAAANTFPTIHSLTTESGGIAGIASTASDGLNIFNNTGVGWTWDASTNTSTITIKLNLNFTGTVAGTDGFTLINSATSPAQKIGSSPVNLGNVNRIFDIPSGGQSIAGQTANSTDLEIDGAVGGSGGLTKTGTGVLKLENGSNTFTGQIEVQAGQLKLVGGSEPDSLSGVNPLLVDGGTLNINGANAAFGAATFTSGGTTVPSATVASSQINAPSFTFNVSSGSSFVMNNVMADGSSSASVVSNGTGTVTIANQGMYTGTTTINAGTFIVNNGTTNGSATSTGNVTLNGGILASGSSGAVISGNVLAGTGSHTIAPGGIGTVGTLSIGGLTSSNQTTLAFDLGAGGGLITNGDLLILGSGTVSIAAGTQLSFGGTTPVAGDDYTLIGGSIGGINLSNFTLPAAPAGLAYSLASSGGFIDLDVAAGGPVTLSWDNGAATGLWNTTDKNWAGSSGNTTYSDGSAVQFTDSNGGAGNYAVTLNSTVSPGSIAATNSNGNYTISGTGKIAGTASLTKSGTGVFTINTAGTSLSMVSISGGSVQLGTSTGLATITSLAISGNGTFDVNNNHVIINYGSGTDPIASIAALLKTGYNHGNWNGAGGIVSTAAAANSTSYGVGYADFADSGNPAGLASGQIEIKYTLLGDANLSGVVDGTDFGIVAANFNKGVSRWDEGDFNYDNTVDGTDFGDLAANFNKGASGASVGEPAYDDPAIVAFAQANGLMAELTSVPEPATISMLVLTAGALGTRRRRRS